MENHRAIPQGYMTVGETAKKAGVTVRTLQYYDKEGLLPPSSESEGGRRLYTYEDIVKLHQIRAMKQLGFTLAEIKTRLPSQNTPEQVSDVLLQQACEVREKIASLTDTLEAIEKLNVEVLQTKQVDWEKYADILVILQAKNELYWVVKHFSGKVLEHVRDLNQETRDTILKTQNRLFETVSELQQKGISPASEEGQAFAEDYWDIVVTVTGDDMSLISEFEELAYRHGDSNWKQKTDFIEQAVDLYLRGIKNDSSE